MKKKCNKCKNVLCIEEFYKNIKNKDGHTNVCKTCIKEYLKTEECIEYRRNYYKKNSEKIRAWRRATWRNHPERNRAYRRKYVRKMLDKNLTYRLVASMRARIRNALNRSKNRKSFSLSSLIGCSAEELKAHIANQFTEGMCWENRGEWHVHHVKPCCCFDLSIPEQQRECFHYTNLKPLWSSENLKLGGKFM